MGILAFSLLAGSVAIFIKNKLLKRWLVGLLIVGVILLNVGFFREDLWFTIDDKEQFSGSRWTEQTSASLYDYWPVFGEEVPKSTADKLPFFSSGDGKVISFEKYSHSARASVEVYSDKATVEFPIVFFPGWEARSNGNILSVTHGNKFGKIMVDLQYGKNSIDLYFRDTSVRKIANWLSLLGGGGMIYLGYVSFRAKKLPREKSSYGI